MKCRGIQFSLRTLMVRALSYSAVAALVLNPALMPVVAGDYRAPALIAADGQMNARFLPLGIGKSIVIDLPRDIKDVLVADPKIATAVVRSAQRAYIIGATVGQTNIVFFDSAGQQIAAYDIAVKRDLNGLRAALKQALPNADIQIEGIGEGIMLSGSASTPVEAQQAGDLAVRLVGGNAQNVINSITVRGRDQVMLKVTIAEVQRSIVKQLGIDLSGSMAYGTTVVKFNNSTPFTANSAPLVGTNNITSSFGSTPSVQASLRAMESAGVVRTLAEPNLTAISGESATFISGGEFPIPTGVTCQTTTGGAIGNCVQTVSFKKFGISLNFTPVVLTEGRISLRVMTEVSEVSTENALTGGAGGTTIPSIKTRRAETTLEIPSGGAMAMAGLIQDQTKQAINGLPGLSQLPILGSLFRSRDFVNNQTELMVLVTPFIVRAVAQKDLSRPDDGFAAASDPQADLLGSLNRIYGVPGRPEPARNYRGTYGFITD
jgi:pilus assembly protein CpaC